MARVNTESHYVSTNVMDDAIYVRVGTLYGFDTLTAEVLAPEQARELAKSLEESANEVEEQTSSELYLHDVKDSSSVFLSTTMTKGASVYITTGEEGGSGYGTNLSPEDAQRLYHKLGQIINGEVK